MNAFWGSCKRYSQNDCGIVFIQDDNSGEQILLKLHVDRKGGMGMGMSSKGKGMKMKMMMGMKMMGMKMMMGKGKGKGHR